VAADLLGLPGLVLGVTSAALGLYALFRGLGLEESLDRSVERVRDGLYAGRVTLVTYLVAGALLVIGGVEGLDQLRAVRETTPDPDAGLVLAGLVHGAVTWFAAAGLTSSLGQITDEYLADRFRWRYLNAPFYIVAIAAVLHGISGFFLGAVELPYLARTLTAGTILGVLSTLTFAVVESRRERAAT
jgi:putative membrane protein